MAESMQHDEMFESLLGDFLDESAELLQRLNDNLLAIDEQIRQLEDSEQAITVDAEVLNELFRAAHSLKGLSAMLGLDQINHLTHKIENVFDAARRSELPLTAEVVDVVLHAVDRVGELVEQLKDPSVGPVDCDSAIEQIQQLLKKAGVEKANLKGAEAEAAIAAAMQDATTDQTPCNEQAEQYAAPDQSSEQPTISSEGPAPDSAEGNWENPLDDVQDEPDISDKYVAIFIDEAELSLDQFCDALLACEQSADRGAVESLMVTAHRIKGSAASVGLNRVAKFAHLMEDLLQRYLDANKPLPSDLVDVLLQCVDAVRRYISSLRKGENEAGQLVQLAPQLVRFQQQIKSRYDSPASQGGTPPTVETSAQQTEQSDVDAQAEQQPGSDASAEQKPGQASQQTQTTEPADYKIDNQFRQLIQSRVGELDQGFLGIVVLEPGLQLAGLKAGLLYERLSHVGDVCYFEPPPERFEEIDSLDVVKFAVSTEQPIDVIHRQLQAGGVKQVILEAFGTQPAAKPQQATGDQDERAKQTADKSGGSAPAAKAGSQPATQRGQKTAGADASSKPNETLRVDITRLDRLMNLAGELVINRAQLSQVAQRFKRMVEGKRTIQVFNNLRHSIENIVNSACHLNRQSAGDSQQFASILMQLRRIQDDMESLSEDIDCLAQLRSVANELGATLHQLDRITDGIQQSVMETRMVPIGPLFARFKRVVRDITRINGKQIRLVIQGEKTELDKRMIDELGDPLIHMVRNAADHGIEPPEVRKSLGKPPEGTITLSACHRGNSIVIQVSDDGKGLDADKILRKALEKGIISESEAERLSTQQIYQLIWEPGLSTAEKVTQVSGRGVGMDIVKSKIEELNGTIELDSTPGKGTTVTIKLPLTLAILPSLMVEIGDQTFAIPLEAVDEIVRLDRSQLATIQGVWTAIVRGQFVSIVQLGDVFSWHGERNRRELERVNEIVVVIVGEQERKIALVVDRVIGEEDVVIKSLAENFRNLPGIAGASILGDGRVSLILDVTALTEMASKSAACFAAT